MSKRQKEIIAIVTSLIVIIVAIVMFACNRNNKTEDTINKQDIISENSDKKPDEMGVAPTPTENILELPAPTPTPSLEELVNSTFVVPQPGQRPFAVMIDNEGLKSLPQGGIQMAQVIYETLVEGGETRLMPVYWNTKPEMIGPVRSARHYFLDFAMEHDALYVHIGWSPMAERDISLFNINNINGVTDGWVVFYDLTNDKNNWQDSYTDIDRIVAYAENKKYGLGTDIEPLFRYNEANVTLDGGKKAEKVNIRYSGTYTCGFEYDEESKTYKRMRKGKPHMERITEEQLSAKNIIIQKVDIFNIKGDSEGRQEVVTTGSGEATYITCGKAVTINWSKKKRSDRTEYYFSNGEPLVLNPGQTWIQIVPDYGEVNIE